DLETTISDGALFVGEGRIVDDRGLFPTTGHHVAVDSVPAGVADAVGEPAPVHARVWIEHLARWLNPVDVLRGLGPEALRVALPAVIHLVIAARHGSHGGHSASSRAPARIELM